MAPCHLYIFHGKTHGKNQGFPDVPSRNDPYINPLDELPVEHSCYGAQDGLGVSRTEGTADLLSALFGTSGDCHRSLGGCLDFASRR